MTATLDRPATTAPERSRGIPHVAALDGLRGIAILAVLVYHGGHLSGGFLGVDLFFVLSGYLITSLLLAEWRATSGVSLGGFYARRARRLLPALFLMLLGVSLYAAIWAQPAELARIRGDAFATLAYVANWHTIFGGHTYWSLFSAPSPLEHTWSLAIEEQFYLVWPLVALAVLRRSRDAARALLLVSLTGACAAGAWMVVLVLRGADVSRVYLGTDTRIAAMLFGAALAAGQARFAPLRARARAYLEIAAILAACFLAWAYASAGGLDSWLYRGGLFACGVAATVIIAAVTHPHRGPLAYLFAWKPLCALGLVSYGLYLWHWPVYLVLNPSRTHLTDPALLIVRIGASLVIATVSYVLVEIPIRRGALAPRVARALAPATACAAVIAILATTASSAVPSVAMSSDAMPSIAMSSGSVSSVALLPAARASAAASAR
ncbi:MAG TPA: acyltransferase, partial [Acidimicrobiia bacterium]|nr:acyltransferase [Acidimicrobiia bacterium]